MGNFLTKKSRCVPLKNLVIVIFVLIVVLSSKNVLADYTKGREAFFARDYNLAIKELEEFVVESPDHLNANYLLGLAYYYKDQIEQAEKYLKRAHNLAAQNIKVVNNLARTLREQGKVAEGVALLNQFLIEYENQDDPYDLAQTYNILGTLYMEENNLQEASKSLEKSVSLNNNNFYALNNLGLVYIQMGKYEQALVSLERAVELNPPVAFIYNNLGIVYENLNDFFRARDAYQKALEILPGYEKAWKNLKRVENLIEHPGN